jgi:outer membrane protein assembly factor BamB
MTNRRLRPIVPHNHSLMTTFLQLSIATVLITTPLAGHAGNWPAWRGPDGTGVSNEKDLPLKWSAGENMRWRVELPGAGNASPIVWGNRVFVPQAVKSENRRTLMCFDRADGKLLWQSGVTYTEKEPTQQANPYCSGSPVTDGDLVYVCFGSAGVYAYDFSGKEAWHRDLGKLNHMFGNSVSPVLYGNLCILNFGPDEKARIVALDKKNGEVVWQMDPPKLEESERQQGGQGGPGGRGGSGGRGGFGPGTMLSPQILSQADKNADLKLSKEEFVGLADTWFDKLDTAKAGKLTQEEFVERIGIVLPPPDGADAGPNGPRRGGGPGRFIGPGFFTAADVNKDGSLTRAELKTTFEKWFASWDTDKTGSVSEDKLREGLTAALPRPNAGGGGPGGGPGGRGMGGPPSGSWSTPLIINTGGRDELVVSSPNRLVGYDPKTGKQLWFSKGIGGTIYTTPVWGGGAVMAMSSGMGGGNAIAITPGGTGDVSESHRVWRQDRFKSGIGTGVVHEGRLYTISQDGMAGCYELKTGERVWEERLKGPGTRTSSWSSMLLADGKIYVPNQSGDVFVLRASPKFEVLGTNSVSETTNASLAACDGEVFMRTDKALWCFGKGE